MTDSDKSLSKDVMALITITVMLKYSFQYKKPKVKYWHVHVNGKKCRISEIVKSEISRNNRIISRKMATIA